MSDANRAMQPSRVMPYRTRAQAAAERAEAARAAAGPAPRDRGALEAAFRALPEALRRALRAAAARNGWESDTWAYQIALVENARLRGESLDALAAAYADPPRTGAAP